MGLKKRVFPYTQLFQEPDAAAAFFQMGERTNIKLLAHEIIDAFFIYENRPAAITKTICTALMMMYEAGRAAALAERPANIDALQEIRARRSEHDKAEQGARR